MLLLTSTKITTLFPSSLCTSLVHQGKSCLWSSCDSCLSCPCLNAINHHSLVLLPHNPILLFFHISELILCQIVSSPLHLHSSAPALCITKHDTKWPPNLSPQILRLYGAIKGYVKLIVLSFRTGLHKTRHFIIQVSKWQLFADDITESTKCPWATLSQLFMCFNDT